MVLAEAPTMVPFVVDALPDASILRNKGITEGTPIMVFSRSSYGTMKVGVSDDTLASYSETFIGTTVAEKIQVTPL